MKFRPCIDIHNGRVKQIVGGSLSDENNLAEENFVSEQDAEYYALLYKKYGLSGGHIILLNPPTSDFYEETKNQALKALRSSEGSLQIGGGITDENAMEFLEAGASHVIVTSYVFQNGRIEYDHLKKLRDKVSKDRIVLDLSCRSKDGRYYIVTNRWQKYTTVELCEKTLENLSGYCDEFLVHAVDVEGKSKGIETRVADILGSWAKKPITYAGGVHSLEDILILKNLGRNRVDVTVGSALDLFGGKMKFEDVLNICK